jgi:hypothetical protein
MSKQPYEPVGWFLIRLGCKIAVVVGLIIYAPRWFLVAAFFGAVKLEVQR